MPTNRTWYPFQVAFILLNLPGLTQAATTPTGARSHEALADLLFFPTGGGKTEAYLGLTAYTMGLRRLQGVVEGRSGENGVTVLMRYPATSDAPAIPASRCPASAPARTSAARP